MLIRALKIIWVSPNTLIGLLVGVTGLAFGGRCQVRRGCIEFYGGLVKMLLRMSFTGAGTMAMTLGHTIIGQTDASLDIARNHEHVHVRQYETWGPLFIPAYLFMSLWMWLKGKDPYRDNPFEVEAYNLEDPFG
ncbi:MAG: hypothetical protein AAF456_18060 [Planctomycetota bacterium]